MNIATKKLASIALTVSTVLWAAGVASLPLANAQTTSDLQAQIAALLSQIQQLQAQLGTSSSSGSSMSSSCYDFTSDLTVGSTGAAVTALQQVLIAKGYLTAVSAPTGYFGSLTQAAVGKWQAANGITPTAGYFGPKSRAFYASSCVATTGTSGTTGTTGTTGVTTAPATGLSVSLASDNPGAGSLISGTNGGGGAARVPVLAVNFTAGTSGAVTVSSINFTKTGVLSDSSVSGAYLTMNGQVIAQYTSINNGVINFSGLNWQIPAGTTQEVQLAINVAGGLSAGNTTGFSLPAASDVTAFDTNNNAVTPNGTFPLNGNTFTVTSVSNPSLATVVVSSTPIGTQVTAGTQDNLVGAWNFNVQNSKIWLDSLNFHVIGSANMSQIQNVKLFVNGTQVGQTLPSVGLNGLAYFNLTSNPGVLNTGSNNVQVFADVMGSPSMNFNFEILNGYDIYAVDSQYNVPVQANSSVPATPITIQTGAITVTQDSGTPTGNVAKGQSQVTLAKFDIYAAGEAVRVQYLDFTVAFTGVTSGATISSEIKNVSLIDDAGSQVGSTINTPPSGNSCADSGFSANVTSGAFTSTNGTYEDCFGTSASPINYVVPANTTRILSLKADVQSGASFSTVVAGLPGNSGNLQGVTSSQSASSGSAQGSSLTLANSSLTIAQNTALGNQVVTAGVQNQEIGSYALSASAAEGVNVNNVSIVANGSYFSNLKLMVNGAQFGTTQPTVGSGTTYTFSGTPFNIPVGGTVDVSVYANTLSSAATGTVIRPATVLSSCSASGQISFSSITCSSLSGQNITFGSGAVLTLAADSSQAPIGQLVMGSTGNPLATVRFTETSNNEPANITALTVTDSSTNAGGFSNLELYNGSSLLGTASPQTSQTTVGTSATTTIAVTTPSGVATTSATDYLTLTINGTSIYNVGILAGVTSSSIATSIASAVNTNSSALQATAAASGSHVVLTSTVSGANGNTKTAAVTDSFGGTVIAVSGGTFGGGSNTVTTQNNVTGGYTFNFATPVQVPQGSSLSLTLKGDAATYQSGAAVDNTVHQFTATSSGVTAVGATSNDTVAISGSSAGNTQTLLRTTLGFAATPLGSTSGRGKVSTDQLATLSFSANSAGSLAVNTVSITFSGTAATSSLIMQAGAIRLLDENNNSLGTCGVTTSTPYGAGTYTWNFNLCTATSTNVQGAVSAGATRNWTLVVNDSDLVAVSGQNNVNLVATINSNSDIEYTDALSTPATSALTLPSSVLTPIQLNSVVFAQGI